MGCSPSKEETENVTKDDEKQNKMIDYISTKRDPWQLSFNESTKYDPWEGSIKINKPKTEKTTVVQIESAAQENDVSIVDLRSTSDAIRAVQKISTIVKTSESQTDNPDGVDFDWDLSDKTDTETQVC